MKIEWWFPLAKIILNAGASGVYLYQGDYRMAVYWCAATVLTVTITI